MQLASGDRIEPTPRTTVRRLSNRAVCKREVIYEILDEALTCHVGFVDNGQPFVIPTMHVRIDDRLYIHGSPGSRMIQRVRDGAPTCITVTLLDGLVLARSHMHHSMNYRSVLVLAAGVEIKQEEKKLAVLESLVKHVVRGRWHDARQPYQRELAATAVVSFALDEASAKVRTGPPIDEEEDYALRFWAGVIPLALRAEEPISDPRLSPGIEPPEYAASYARPTGAAG